MHGFGAPGDDLVPLADVLSRTARYVFPAAPLELGGFYGNAARAWWLIDIARLEHQLTHGTLDTTSVPDGLPAAREQMLRLVDQVEARFGGADHKLVLGGFSQGAMTAVDVALHREKKPAGLILWSGTIVADSEWSSRYASLKGVRVMQSHGRHDPLLPFPVAEALRDELVRAGATVDWQPFLGGHEIPRPTLIAANAVIDS
jgi:phospholipase/carboxylesterase